MTPPGRPIEPEVLVTVLDALRRSVPAWRGGRMSAAAIERGTEVRSQVRDWINVDIKRDPDEDSTCGTAFVGANPSRITLNNDVCSCGSTKIPGAVTLHEVGHAMGFFHVSDRRLRVHGSPGPPACRAPPEPLSGAIHSNRS